VRPPMQRSLQQRVGAARHWRGGTGPVGAAEDRRRHDLHAAQWACPCAACIALGVLCCALFGMRPTGRSVAGERRGVAVGGAHEDAVARGGACKDPSAAAWASAGGGGCGMDGRCCGLCSRLRRSSCARLSTPLSSSGPWSS
jgi:hypothetical protein